MIYSGKKAVVLGLGASGEAAAVLLREEGANVTVCESGEGDRIHGKAASLRGRGIRVLTGSDADNDGSSYDIAILSPGIDPAAPIVRNIVAKQIPIIGELELAFEECACPVIAITGTNGKTTTTELTTAMLSGCGVRTMASGNIGVPFSEAVRRSNELDVMTLEVSSFQLEAIRAFHPHVAVWLNFSPNHLDRYRDVTEYRAAKLRLFENLEARDFAVINARESLPVLPARTLTFSAYTESADFTLRETTICYRGVPVLDQRQTRLAGVHNAENLMAALGIGLSLGLDFDRMTGAMTDYTAPVHRCEEVRHLNGVRWVNDSKATNLDAMEKALLSHPAPLVLIAGGKDKGFEFAPIAPLVRERVHCAILIGEMRERIAKSWPDTQCVLADSLEQAVALAKDQARPDDVVLFSPGTSSFDMFRNYGERGNRFKELVHALPDNS